MRPAERPALIAGRVCSHSVEFAVRSGVRRVLCIGSEAVQAAATSCTLTVG
jgi:hypothetical protein